MNTISLILEALKPYRNLRFSNDDINANINPTETMKNYKNRKCKWFYEKIVKKKVVKNSAVTKWSRIFGDECKCEDFYLNKIKVIQEVKLSEFNYKLFTNILATGANLYKWNKMNRCDCIYCGTTPYESKHLIMECPHTQDLWSMISNMINIQISWREIIIGMNNKPAENYLISFVCYIIYKKFLVDKEKPINGHYINLKTYVKCELKYKLEVYEQIPDMGNSVTSVNEWR